LVVMFLDAPSMNATNSVNARPKNLLARLNRRKMVDRFTDAPL
jgi:hypothetical protein